MDPITSGIVVFIVLILLLAIGTPIAFALGAVALGSLVFSGGMAELQYFGVTFFHSFATFGFVSIPMFILMGAAVASSPTGRDLYRALDVWVGRLPGGLAVSSIGACAIFAALSGSSSATCAAIGKMGIPEMRARGYPSTISSGSICAGGTLGILIPPSITMIVYGLATKTSIGRLFIAGVVPGIMLAGLFIAWTIVAAKIAGKHGGFVADTAVQVERNVRENLSATVRVLPFLAIVIGVVITLYGGFATPSEAAGVGALMCVLLAVIVYRMWQFQPLKKIIYDTLRESVMLMLIIGFAAVFAHALSALFVTQTVASAIGDLEINRWLLMLIINVFLLVCGMFLPPVAAIVMTAPILLPIILNANFDPYWFAVVATINLEVGLISPPVGLNLFIVNGIAPDVSLQDILIGSLPYVLLMLLLILILCFFPWLATGLPSLIMG